MHRFPRVSSSGVLILAGGLLYVLAWPLDKSMLPLGRELGQFVEELLEADGALLMLMAAIPMLGNDVARRS